MSFARVVCDTYGSAEAELAVNTVNMRLMEVANEARAIEEEAAAIVETALHAEPKEAGKLVKTHDALRARKLALLMHELRIPALKRDAETAIRIAARAESERLAENLQQIEEDLSTAARALGYEPDSRQWRQLFATDPNRRDTLGALSNATNAALNFFACKPEDRIREAELRTAIGAALR